MDEEGEKTGKVNGGREVSDAICAESGSARAGLLVATGGEGGSVRVHVRLEDMERSWVAEDWRAD
jgi:hypothetical protein